MRSKSTRFLFALVFLFSFLLPSQSFAQSDDYLAEDPYYDNDVSREYEVITIGIERIDAIDSRLDKVSDYLPVEVEIGSTLVSAYMWRGQKAGGDTSYQPWMTISPEFEPVGNFSVTGWVNMTQSAPRDTDTEWNWIVDYNFDLLEVVDSDNGWLDFNMDFGYIYYHFPPTATKSQEIYFGVTYNYLLNPSLFVYHDWDQGSGQWWEFGVSHTFDLRYFLLSAYSKLAYNNSQWAAESTSHFSLIESGMSIPIPIGSHFTLEPFFTYTFRLKPTYNSSGADVTEDEFVGGLGMSLIF